MISLGWALDQYRKIHILDVKCVCVCVCVFAAQACPILCDPMDCHTSGSSVYKIFQARILEWVAIPFSRGSS